MRLEKWRQLHNGIRGEPRTVMYSPGLCQAAGAGTGSLKDVYGHQGMFWCVYLCVDGSYKLPVCSCIKSGIYCQHVCINHSSLC